MKRQTTKILCLLAVLFLAVVVSVPLSKAQIAPHQPLVCAGSWSAGPNLPSPAVRSVGVYFPANGKFYAVGGRSADTVGSDFTHPFEYDPVSNSWTTKSATYLDNQVNNMACGVLTDAGTPYIYCVGGSAAGQTTAASRVFRYDPVTDTISAVAAPWPGAAGTILPGGFTIFQNKLYILGGFNINVAMTDQIWEFTPGTNAWVQKGAVLPVQRGYIPTTTIGSLIYTGGGASFSGGLLADSTDSFVYDPVADSISTIASIPRATGETRALNFNGQMWVMGGGRTAPNPSNEVDVYDPGTNSWTTGPSFTTARRNFPTDTDGSSRVWLAGGYASDNVTALSTMEIFQCAATPTPTATNTPTSTPTSTPTPTPTAVIGNQGCGSGYWKQQQHFGSWCGSYTPDTLVSTVFDTTDCGCNFSSLTFLQALQGAGFGPTVCNAQAKLYQMGVAALLNACPGSGVAYPLSTAQVISEVNTALQSCDRTAILNEAGRLDGFNNGPGGCPLH
jgi:hypothetical protein